MNYSVYESKEDRIVHRRVIPTGKEEGVEELLLLPTKIEAEGVENADCLLLPRPAQLIYSDATPFARVDSGATLILDFGEVQNGGVRIFTDSVPVGATVRVRFGESYAEVCANLGEKNATNDHAVRDVTLPLSAYAETAFGTTGYRYVRLDFSSPGELFLKNVYGTCRILCKKPQYVCPETGLIGEIYHAAKRTVDLCCTDYVVDGIKRDRLVWVGDMHPEMLALTTLYGRCESLERSLDLAREATPLPRFMNNFPTYSIWWVIILADYYPYASAEFFARQKDYFTGLIAQLSACVSESGEISLPHYFFDWQTHESEEEKTGVAALFLLAAKKAKELFAHYGLSEEPAKELISRLQKKPIPQSRKKQVIGMKYLAQGFLSQEEKDALIAGGAQGMSTFMSYYILHAVASFAPEKAVEMMKEYYGAMLALGATSFWEDFSLQWTENAAPITRLAQRGEVDVHGDFGAYCYLGYRHSLCHGWATGVLRFLKEQFPSKG